MDEGIGEGRDGGRRNTRMAGGRREEFSQVAIYLYIDNKMLERGRSYGQYTW